MNTNRILVVTDLSAAGDIALEEATGRAAASGATLAVVHAVPTLSAIRPLFPQRLEEDALRAAELPRHAEAMVRARLAPLVADGGFELFIREGATGEVALDMIESWKPTLVVVGSPADGAVGSVEIIRHAAVPVLVARKSPPTKRVVVGTDFSDPAMPGLRAAATAATEWNGKLTVVHVIEVNPISIYGVALPMLAATPAAMHDAANERMQQTLQGLGIIADTEVAVGPVSTALVEAVKSLSAELLVVATHGRSGLTRFLLGSVTEAMIRDAPCSTLVVRLA